MERDPSVATLMALYIDYNPHKAGLVRQGGPYAWSSFSQACGAGAHAAECRAAYERLFGCSWPEARELILEAFAARSWGAASRSARTAPPVSQPVSRVRRSAR